MAQQPTLPVAAFKKPLDAKRTILARHEVLASSPSLRSARASSSNLCRRQSAALSRRGVDSGTRFQGFHLRVLSLLRPMESGRRPGLDQVGP